MSLLNPAAAYRRSTNRPRIPVVLPLVRVDVDEHGMLDVTVDEVPFPNNDTDGASQLSRAELRPLLDQIATDHDSALRVEIHEPDGKVFTDFHTPEPTSAPRSLPADAAPPTQMEAATAQRPTLTAHLGAGEVTGTGFNDGEEVAVAIVIYRRPADADGSIELQLPVALLERHHTDVLLVGTTSGSIAVTPPEAPQPVREAS